MKMNGEQVYVYIDFSPHKICIDFTCSLLKSRSVLNEPLKALWVRRSVQRHQRERGD